MAKKDKSLPTDREKAEFLCGDGNWHFHGIPRLGIKGIELHDGPCGLRKCKEESGQDDLTHSEKAICYPSPCLTACSWDPSLLEEMGQSVGKECITQDTAMILAPGVNIKRNPLCGRNFEYLSEDPLLSGKMGAGYIRGVQGMNVATCLKHFACNSQESFRFISNSTIDDRALREIYLKPFEIAIKEANPWSVMGAYNLVNGSYCCENDDLLNILKNEWAYDGLFISDWGATPDYIFSHNHGLDVEMPCLYKKRGKEIYKAVKAGLIDRACFDDSVNRMFRLFNRVKRPEDEKPAEFNYEKGHKLATKIAEKSMVLLKNDGVLPMTKFGKACIIGDLARNPRFQGAGSSHVNPYKLESFVSVVQEANPKILFAPGYRVDGKQTQEDIYAAVDLAANCDTVFLFLGLPPSYECEGFDRTSLMLPEEQLRLFDAIFEVNKNIIVVLNCGAPTELPFLNRSRAVLLAYLPGEGGGRAIFNILIGKANPSGHLAETWPLHLSDVPSFGFYPGYEEEALYRESIFVGYRYYLTAGKDVYFPFGYGLSYSKFKQTLALSSPSIKAGGTIKATVKVTNLSDVDGEELVQLYASSELSQVFKPKMTLIAFAKVFVKAKESVEVVLPIKYEDFAHYDMETSSFRVEGGDYSILACANARKVIAQEYLVVKSKDTFESQRKSLLSYFYPPKNGFLLDDDDFENLLGRPLPGKADRFSRPYSMQSTLKDIKNTWIGKKIFKMSSSMINAEPGTPEYKMIESTMMTLPIRSICMSSTSMANPKYAYAILDAANGRMFSALWHLLFGAPKGKRRAKHKL